MNKLRVGIIGAGNIGGKRTASILELSGDVIIAVTDINKEKALELAKRSGAQVYRSWQSLIADKNINAVVVATTTDINVEIVSEALKKGKHVLAEKPLGKNVQESRHLSKIAKKYGRILKVGFNHRHHPAIFKAHQLLQKNVIGKILYIRSVYGHGARPGYDLDWRMQKKFSSGGELLDQGIHIIDLANWFMGNFAKVFAVTRNFYWKKSELEDNAFCQLYAKSGRVVDFHVSLTQWKNKFSFEIFGDKGYLTINGLGGSYGTETLVLGTKVGLGKIPKEKVWTFGANDISWKEEWKEFKNAILKKRQPLGSLKENIQNYAVLEGLYRSAALGKAVRLR